MKQDRLFRLVDIKQRKPNMGERVLFLDEKYKGGYMKEYLPNEEIEIKRGIFVEIGTVKQITDYLQNNYTHWLEEVNYPPTE